jgi:hypothetical protein
MTLLHMPIQRECWSSQQQVMHYTCYCCRPVVAVHSAGMFAVCYASHGHAHDRVEVSQELRRRAPFPRPSPRLRFTWADRLQGTMEITLMVRDLIRLATTFQTSSRWLPPLPATRKPGSQTMGESTSITLGAIFIMEL